MADVNDAGVTPAAGETPADDNNLTFDGWIAGQADEVRGLIDGHVAGLKTALSSERQQRKELQAALRDATKELEQGTEARAQLEGLAEKLELYEQQIGAYDALMTAGVTNVRLAWIAAREAGAIDKRGNINLETLKAEYPELFKRPLPPGNAGAGTQTPPTGATSVDDMIRQKAGRR